MNFVVNIVSKITKNKGIVFLFTLFIIIMVCSIIIPKIEGYSNYNLANPGIYPESEPLLSCSYPFTGRKTVSKNSYNDIWWNYPIFKVGSYAQITNNLRYRKNPDDGVCITSDFCGALYKDNQLKSNISKPLPPAPTVTADNVRVGYYLTNNNLLMGKVLGPELPTF